MTWLQIFPNGNVFWMDGAYCNGVTKTDNSTKALLKVLQQSDAGTWQVARPDKPEPTVSGAILKTGVYQYGFKDGDFHLVMSSHTEEIKTFNSTGKLLWKAPALAKGVNGSDWRYVGANTPPGIYKLGIVYRDCETGNLDPAYGSYTFDMIDLEGQETGIGRAGICLHGGGSECPDPFADYQPLLPTFGCVRMHNADLRDRVLPLYESGTVFLSVFQ